jgi:hypothetical protein
MTVSVQDIWQTLGIKRPAAGDEDMTQIANRMIELFGEKAAHEAADRCNEANHDGDIESYDLWLAITMTITTIQYPNFAARAYEPPKVKYTEKEVWTTAKQMLEFYPETASFAAAQRADGALDEGDMETCSFWIRITKALENMERKSPHHGESLN